MREKKDTLRKIWIYFPLSILAGLAFGQVEYIMIGARELIPDLSLTNLLILIIIMVFIVGLIEELIFRSILQTRLEEFLGQPGEFFFQASFWDNAFYLRHSLRNGIYLLFRRFFLGYLFYRTRSLPLVVMIHGSINVFLFGIIPHAGSIVGLM